MKKYKILIVDDSAFARMGITKIFEKNKKFEVIGIARDGEDAVDKAKMIKPDLITMDVEMNKMNGIEALKRIMRECPTPVVMLSEHTAKGTELSVEALALGAIDCFLKSELIANSENRAKMASFFEKVEVAASARLKPLQAEVIQPETPKFLPTKGRTNAKYEVVVIGTSTGGPNALQHILPQVPSDFPVPIIIAQHMPKGFTKSLAERFSKLCKLKVKEIEDGEKMLPGFIYIAPAGYQSTLKRVSNQTVFRVEETNKADSLYSPSVDITLKSVVSAYGAKALAVILTGMGKDGLEGARDLKNVGGAVITESEVSCVVYGMPKVVFEAGLSDVQSHINTMYNSISFKLYER